MAAVQVAAAVAIALAVVAAVQAAAAVAALVAAAVTAVKHPALYRHTKKPAHKLAFFHGALGA